MSGTAKEPGPVVSPSSLYCYPPSVGKISHRITRNREKMQLVIGNQNYSSWSLRAWLLLTQFQIEFETVKVSLAPEDFRDTLGKYSPSRKVPVLIDNDLTLWDSLAICEHISENYLANRGWPLDGKLRSKARVVSAEMHSSFSALRNALPLNCRATRSLTLSDDVVQDIERIKVIWTQCRAENTAFGPWLFGDFSIADCMYAPVVLRFATYGITTEGASQEYVNTILENQSIKLWLADARAETDVVAFAEVGI